MDVVYNHVFDRNSLHLKRSYQIITLSILKMKAFNGSYCGNDFDSLMKMASKFIVDSTRWVKF